MKPLTCLLIGMLSHLPLGASGIVLAPFNTVIEKSGADDSLVRAYARDLFTQINGLDSRGILGLQFGDVPEGPVKTLIDAAQVCEGRGIDVLIYGQITQTETALNGEIKIYDHSQRKVMKTILIRSSPEDYRDLVQDGAAKVMEYFRKILLVPQETPSVREKNAWIQRGRLGYWLAFGEWQPVFTSFGGGGYSVSVRSGAAWWRSGTWDLYPEMGGDLSLAFGSNTPGLAPSQLYGLEAGVPLGLALTYQRRQEIRLELEPAIRILFLYHQPLYEDPRVDAVSWWGAKAGLDYLWWVSEGRNFGIGAGIQTALFAVTPAYGDLRAYLALVFRGDL